MGSSKPWIWFAEGFVRHTRNLALGYLVTFESHPEVCCSRGSRFVEMKLAKRLGFNEKRSLGDVVLIPGTARRGCLVSSRRRYPKKSF